MKFTISTSKKYYTKEYMELYQSIGFVFDEEGEERYIGEMFFRINTENKPTVEINSIEDLMEFEESFGPLIIDGYSIEIYNDYRE